MANTIKIKAGSGTPTTSDIVDRELAFDTSADILYIRDSNDIVAIGGSASGAVTSVSNLSDNRLVTASGSTTLNGESNLTFDGSTLAVTGSITLGGHSFNDIDIGSEFVDADDHLMSSGAIKEKIESYGYATQTGDITGVLLEQV